MKWEEDEGNKKKIKSGQLRKRKEGTTRSQYPGLWARRSHPWSSEPLERASVATLDASPAGVCLVSQAERHDRGAERVRKCSQVAAKEEAQPKPRDKSQYCSFHVDYGHITKDCIALRLVVLELLR